MTTTTAGASPASAPSARAAAHALRAHAGAAALSGGALLAGLVLALLAAANDRLPGDLSATRAVQQWPFPGQTFADVIRVLTSTEFVLAVGLALTFVALRGGRRRPAIAFAAGLVLVLQTVLKELVDRPRPAPALVDLRAGFTSLSFPSGHVMSGTYLYGFIALGVLATPRPEIARAAVTVAAAVFLALAGLANVFLGVHWPSDVIGGYVWALAVLMPAATVAFPSRP